MIDWLSQNFVALINVIVIDVVLAGDNAIIVGLAASRVAPEVRGRVIFWGMVGAVVLRIAFAAVTVQLLAIVGLMLAGGILLLWVCWKMYRELVRTPHAAHGSTTGDAAAPHPPMSFRAAVTQIVIADVSMSLDNVLAVAGAASEHRWVLIVGLVLSVGLMGAAATIIAKLLKTYHWIAYVGLAIILWVALDMIYRGWVEVATKVDTIGNLFQ